MAGRYPLRNRMRSGSAPDPATPGSAAIPGAFRTTEDVSIDSLSSAMTSLALTDGSSERSSSEVIPGLLYSQVASRPPSPRSHSVPREASPVSSSSEQGTASSQPASSSGADSAFHPTGVTPTPPVDPEDDGAGPWIPVTRNRVRKPSPEKGRSVPPVGHGGRPVDARSRAATVHTESEDSDGTRKARSRAPSLSDDGRAHNRRSSPHVFEEGSSKRKGKTVDPREWGAVDIPEEELDPEAQEKELRLYSTVVPNVDYVLQNDPDYDEEAQAALLKYWHTLKARRAKPSKDNTAPVANVNEASVSTARQRRNVQFSSKTTKAKKAKVNPTLHPYAPAETIVDGVLSATGNAPKPQSKPKSPKRHHQKTRASDDPKDATVPAGQIAPNSYLGFAMGSAGTSYQRRGRSKTTRPLQPDFPIGQGGGGDGSGSSSSSSSSGSSSSKSSRSRSQSISSTSSSRTHGSSSSSSSDSDTSSSSTSSPSSTDRKRRRRHKYKAKRKSKKPALKPAAPTVYDGRSDPEVFHRFVRQMTEMINGYDISRNMIPSTIANYLSGRAYDFYANTVAENPRKWSKPRDFFIGLFNYCFPMDFRLQIRAKLEKYRQYERTVRDYAHGLHSLMRLAGHSVEDQESVIRLWNGLNISIQESLWDHKLSPLVNSWDEVLREAEFIEASRRVKEGMRERNRTSTTSSGTYRRRSPLNRDRRSHRHRHRKPPNRREQSASPKRDQRGPTHTMHPRLPRHNLSRNNRNRSRQQQRDRGGRASRTQPSHLSDEKRAELQAQGKCFICEETGHFSRNCPNANKVLGSKSDRAPGTAAFSVEPDFSGVEGLRELVESVPTTDELQLNSATIGPYTDIFDVVLDELDDEYYDGLCEEIYSDLLTAPFDLVKDTQMSREFHDENYRQNLWNRLGISAPSRYSEEHHPSMIGDVYAQRATQLLEKHAPYCCGPGKSEIGEDCIYGGFCVYRVSDSQHVIMNDYTDDDLLVDSSNLQDPNFDLPRWYQAQLLKGKPRHRRRRCCRDRERAKMGDSRAIILEQILRNCSRRLGTSAPPEAKHWYRFSCESRRDGSVRVFDDYLTIAIDVQPETFNTEHFDIWNAFSTMVYRNLVVRSPALLPFSLDSLDGELLYWLSNVHEPVFVDDDVEESIIELNSAQPFNNPIQRNAAIPRDFRRIIPEPIVVMAKINGHTVRALLDSGSLSDFMSAKLAHQLKIKTFELAKPLPVQLAVQGSRAKINLGCKANLAYQSVSEERYFDIINLLNYDLILGTPFLYQHQVILGMNPTTVTIGSSHALPVEGKQSRTIESRVAEVLEDKLEAARKLLREYAAPICQEASGAPLPPLRAINHTIPLKDPSKVYSWRPSKCPDAHRDSWCEKRDAYLQSGRWKMTSARNTSPMMLLTKPGTGINGVPPRLRVVADLRERNDNTIKLTSPLPDMEAILRRVSKRKYRSLIDGKDAYEHIRVIPEHVERTAMTTPDGNMVSLVMQQGDCNAVATYQTLMNHIFGPYIGVFMDVYLDDIVIYSDTLEDHIKHCKMVIDVLKREKLYLSATKLHFLAKEMKILGRIVDDNGIRMDPHKVDSVLNWKTPTSKELLRGFLGSVGYLADDIANIRIPMGILSSMTGSESIFKWEPTHQRAFEEIKMLVHQHRTHRRVPLDYSKSAPPIWLVTDGSIGGIAGVVIQGKNWKDGRVAAFFSAKLTSAQANYPVHEIEMLAGVEAMLRHRDILLGCPFTWITDHKGLTHLLKQKNLSGRQVRWLEKISEFDFCVEYVPGVDNVLADALSRLYSNDQPGTVRMSSEYTQHDDDNDLPQLIESLPISKPVFVGLEASAMQLRSRLPLSQPKGSSASNPPRKELRKVTAKPDKPSPSQTQPEKRRKVVPPPAETGRPETSREFAKRIKRVVLHGPRQQRQEGGRSTDNHSVPQQDFQLEGAAQKLPEKAGEHVPDKSTGQLLNYVSESSDGIDLTLALKGQYEGDPFFKTILEAPKNYRNFRVEGGLVFLQEREKVLLCIPDIRVEGRSAREIVIAHAHSLLAHLGSYKTLCLLRDHVWWKTLVHDVQVYCDTCMTCKRSKPNNQKPYGLLTTLEVPEVPWEVIGIDFVGPLPESKDRNAVYDSITVIIDHLTCMVHLVPSRTTYNAKQVAELVFAEVYKLHGMPKRIVSDRDVIFTSTFWSHLHQLMGTKLRMSSAYHPESDGATERANRTITQMLRQCIGPSQRDWVSKLPAIEFAVNLARSESTGYAPFFLNTGRLPRSMIWDNAGTEEYPAVRVYAQKMKSAVMAAHDSIIAARVKQTRDANRKRRPSPFEKGDLVYVSTKNMTLPRGQARKLIPKFIGPYKILRDFGNNSYQLDLSSQLKKRGIHDVFHSSLLRIHEPNDDRLFPGRLDSQVMELEIQDNEWAIDRIRSHAGKGSDAIFETIWKSGDVTWVPYSTLANLEALTTYLDLLGVDDISHLGEGSGRPPLDDPQVYLGSMALYTPQYKRRPQHPFPMSPTPCLSCSSHQHALPPCSSASHPSLSHSANMPTKLSNLYLFRFNSSYDLGIHNLVENCVYRYTPEQVDLILKEDRRLRGLARQNKTNTRQFSPAGYRDFAVVVNSDSSSQYGCAFTRADGTIEVVRKPFLRKELIPDEAVPKSREDPMLRESRQKYAIALADFLVSEQEKRRNGKRARLEGKELAEVVGRPARSTTNLVNSTNIGSSHTTPLTTPFAPDAGLPNTNIPFDDALSDIALPGADVFTDGPEDTTMGGDDFGSGDALMDNTAVGATNDNAVAGTV